MKTQIDEEKSAAEIAAYEKKGRDMFDKLAERLHLTNIIYSDSRYTPYDAYCLNKNNEWRLVEIKYRSFYDLQKYEKEGFILEYDKYIALINMCSTDNAIQSKVQPIYINFFCDPNQADIAAWWNLNEITPIWFDKWCQNKENDKTLIIKKVCLLPIVLNQTTQI